MESNRDPSAPVKLETTRTSIVARVRNYFLTGLVIAAPLAITFYLVWWFIGWIDSWVRPLIPTRYNPEQYLPFAMPGLGVLLAFILITLLGFLTANLLGRSLIAAGERLLGRTPLVRTIYGGLKQMFETMLTNKAPTFNKVVLVEFPRKDTWSIAFIAAAAKGEIREVLTESDAYEDEIISVYVPTTPNPTSGYLLFAKRKELIELDMSIEDGAKLVISAGLVSPEYHKRTKILADRAKAKRKPERVS